MHRLFGAAVVVSGLVIACTDRDPRYPVEIIPDAESACANLRTLSCPEGYGSIGGVSCSEIVSRRHALKSLPLACWMTAKTVVEAKGCGSLRCIE